MVSEVKCECKSSYIGDGFSCTGNLLQVLQSTPTFSNFLTVSLDFLLSHRFTPEPQNINVLQFTFLIFLLLQQILNYSQVSESGKHFVKRLSNLSVQSTLFVPDNNGLPDNQVSHTERSRISLSLNMSSLSVPVYVSPQTLSQRDIEFHLSDGRALPVSQLKNGSRIRTRVGSLTVFGVANLLNPSSLVRFITPPYISITNKNDKV